MRRTRARPPFLPACLPAYLPACSPSCPIHLCALIYLSKVKARNWLYGGVCVNRACSIPFAVIQEPSAERNERRGHP